MPVTVTSQVEEMLGDGLELVRTPASLQDLTKAAAEEGVVFAGATGGGYVFPEFLPAYDASASLCKLLELLAPLDVPFSEVVAELPKPTLIHRVVQCPWALKGAVMRALNERFADGDVDLTDGIKIFFDERGLGAGAARPGRAADPRLRRGRFGRGVRAAGGRVARAAGAGDRR